MTDLTFVKRHPDKGYYGKQLWLPKAHINARSVKRGLEFPMMDDSGLSYLQLWKDCGDHLIVPREYKDRDKYDTLPFPVISSQPPRLHHVEIKSRIKLDYKKPEKTTQRDAFSSMVQAGGGLLNLACGSGKTIIALHYLAHKQVPALVVVNNTTLIDQWQIRVKEFLRVPGGVGVIQGPPTTWDWEGRGVVIAMVHSLALRAEEIPLGMDRYFGVVLYDEVHHLSAPLFVQTAPMFYGERHGLTATTNREDGLEAIYQYHIGDVYHRDLAQEMKPRIYIQQCPVRVDFQSPVVQAAICDAKGRVSIPKLRTYLGTLPECNEFIAEKLRTPLLAGRKILALSHSVDQLRALNQMFEDSGLCTGSERPADRIRTLRTKKLTFGTLQLVREALDEASLDTLFFLTPFGSQYVEDGGANTLQQGMGRVQRYLKGKKTPVVTILDYIYIQKFHRMCNHLKQLLNKWPADQGGPLSFKVLRPHTEETEQ